MTPSPPTDGSPADVLLVKLGGSLITDKTRAGTPLPETLRRLAGELAAGLPQARQRGLAVVVGHGSGSFGHVAAAHHRVVDGVPDFSGGGTAADEALHTPTLVGASLTQARAGELHALVVAALHEAGLAPFSIAPSSTLVADGRIPASFHAEPLVRALRAGLLPVVYGDVVMDRRQGVAICSTEAVFQALAEALPEHGLRVREVLWLGRTAGIYDDAGAVIREVRPGDAAARHAGAAEGTDVTGGMAHRLEAALELARRGVASRVADGTVPDLLRRALQGVEIPGTRVPAAPDADRAAPDGGADPAPDPAR